MKLSFTMAGMPFSLISYVVLGDAVASVLHI
jgi:hypothetical protein